MGQMMLPTPVEGKEFMKVCTDDYVHTGFCTGLEKASLTHSMGTYYGSTRVSQDYFVILYTFLYQSF